MMKTRSFRLRIALLSVLLSGSILIFFGVGAWMVFQRTALTRVDEDLRNYAHPHLGEPYAAEHWERVSEGLRFTLGDGDAYILLVKDRDDRVVYRSGNWPDDLPPETFSPPSDALASLRPPPGAPASPETAGSPPEGDPPGPLPLQRPEFISARAAGHQWRVGRFGNSDVTFVLGLNADRFTVNMARVRNAFLLALPGALILIALGGWFLSERALRPVEALARTAEGITAKGLDQRIPTANEDAEFTRLITVFNQMLDRLESGFEQAVRFSADAAHELKTPLTILQGQLDQALQAAEPGSEQQQTLNALLEEVQRLKSIIRKLLLLSLADSGQLKLGLRPLDLSHTLEAVGEDLEVLSPRLTVKQDITPGLWVMADSDMLKQVVQNLASNALKYNQKGGWIALRLRADDSTVRFSIANSGKGIPPENRGRIFERFFRADKSRSRKVEGFGLGLSLSREIVRAHHGDLVLEDSPPGVTTFTMTLPRAQAPESGSA